MIFETIMITFALVSIFFFVSRLDEINRKLNKFEDNAKRNLEICKKLEERRYK